jgi:hypothetical protein
VDDDEELEPLANGNEEEEEEEREANRARREEELLNEQKNIQLEPLYHYYARSNIMVAKLVDLFWYDTHHEHIF